MLSCALVQQHNGIPANSCVSIGMHKHFRMLAISEYMRSQGYAPSDAEHTRIPGIWRKLESLYNLPGLDEREDALVADTSDEAEPPAELYCPFELPDDEFGDLMFDRRLAKDGSSSPVASPHAESRRGSPVPDTEGMLSHNLWSYLSG